MNENQDNQQNEPADAAASQTGDGANQSFTAQPEFSARPTEDPKSARFFQWIRSLGITRGRNRWVGGVCSGLAEKWNIDPVIVRGLVVVLTLFFGVGLFAYGVAWALLPEPDGRIHAEEVARGTWTAGTTGAAAMVLFGLAGPGQSVIWNSHDRNVPWGGAWIIAVIVVLIWAAKRGKFQRGAGQSWQNSKREQNGQGNNRHHRNQWNNPSHGAPASTLPADGDPGVSLPYTNPPWKGGPSQANWKTATWPASDEGFSTTDFSNTGEPVQAFGPHGPAGPLGTVKTTNAAVKRRNRLGAPATLLIFGLAVIVGAVILLLNQSGAIDLNGYAFAAAVAGAAVTMGLGILVSGFTGRTAGGLGTLSIIALVIAGLSSVGHLDLNQNRFGNQSWAPQTVAQAESGFSAAFGNSTLDLTNIGTETALASNINVPVNLAASSVTIKVPSSIPVTVKSDLAAANLTVEGSTENGGGALVQSSTTEINPKATGKGIVITLDGAAANVKIIPVSGK